MPSLDALFHGALYLCAVGIICWLVYRSAIPDILKTIIIAVICLVGIVWIGQNIHIGNLSH